MAVNPLPTTATELITTGGSNSSSQMLAATTNAIRRLKAVTLINTGTNTGAVRLYAATASSGQPFLSARLTGGQHSSQHFVFTEEGVDIAAGVLARGALGTPLVVLHYTNE